MISSEPESGDLGEEVWETAVLPRAVLVLDRLEQRGLISSAARGDTALVFTLHSYSLWQ